MGKNWSASRVGTFVDCPLKYKFNYVEGWTTNKKLNTEKADKGSAFHETVEQYHTGMPKEDLLKVLQEKVEKYGVNTTDPSKDNYYSYDRAMDKFFCFWDTLIKPKEDEGWKVSQEGWTRGTIQGEPFVGALDLCLESEDKLIIYDYKTGKSINANSYKPQQVLYAYLKGKERGWDIKTTCANIRLFIFGPLMTDLESKTLEQNTLRSVKEIKYDEKDMNEVINDYYMKTIDDIHNAEWDKVEGKMSFSCSWCPYCGSLPNDEGFSGCACSRAQGLMAPDDIKYIKK